MLTCVDSPAFALVCWTVHACRSYLCHVHPALCPALHCFANRSEPRLVLHDVVLVIPEQSQIDAVIYWVRGGDSVRVFVCVR